MLKLAAEEKRMEQVEAVIAGAIWRWPGKWRATQVRR